MLGTASASEWESQLFAVVEEVFLSAAFVAAAVRNLLIRPIDLPSMGAWVLIRREFVCLLYYWSFRSALDHV